MDSAKSAEPSTLPFAVNMREALPDDLGFIFSTWLKHYRQHSRVTRDVNNTVFFSRYHVVVERLLARSLVVVACQEDKPNVIIGYAVLEPNRAPPVVHWIYVKGPWRNLGIARKLLGSLDLGKCLFTHWTNDVEALRGHCTAATYDPYAV